MMGTTSNIVSHSII